MGGAPVFEFHHLLLPGTQAPSLGADGEYAVVLHTHLVELSGVKLRLLRPQLQVNLLVTWKEEGPGRGCASLLEQRGGSSTQQAEGMEASQEASPTPSLPLIWQAAPHVAEQTWL